jgi:hypothetical protein
MLDYAIMKRWCTPLNEGSPFLRPFVVRGQLAQGGAMIVGANPATPIGITDDVELDEHIQSLYSVDGFLPLYSRVRALRGKTRPSPTRVGLDAASKWLLARGFQTVLDTNISPYPTKDEEQWKRLSDAEKALWVFPEVVSAFRPTLVVLHGKSAYEHFVELYAPALRQERKFSDTTKELPHIGRVRWPNGDGAEVYVCRHLRYFGTRDGGKTFAPYGRHWHNQQPGFGG